MKRILSLILALTLLLCAFPSLAVGAAEDFVTQTTMVRALETLLKTDAPLMSEYSQKSPYGGKSGNLGFAQTVFYRLFLTELGESADLSESDALTMMSEFPAGDTALAATIPAARGALRFGDLIQYGKDGHVSVVLGETDGRVVVYDCGFGGDKLVRLRLVSDTDLTEQATTEGDEGGLRFFRAKNRPVTDITLTLASKPKTLSYYLNATPTTEGALLNYYMSELTGKQEIQADNPDLKTFASTEEAGEVPMLFLYGSAITFCVLEVKNETVESVQVETLPTKVKYTTEEELDMTGAVVTAKMLDGTTVTLEDGEYTATYAFTAAGSAVVTVSYGGKSTTFSVTLTDPPVTRLSVIAPTKTEYYIGERLDLTGAMIVVDYEKEKNKNLPLLESMLSPYDTTLPGKQTITVTFGEKTAEFTINVLENTVAALRLATNLNKQYRKGAMIDLAKIELTVLYENGQSRTVSARDCVVTVNGKETSTFEEAGEAKVVFTYQGVSTGTVAVTVSEDPMSQFITAAIVIIGCLIGIPLLILLAVFLLRRVREKKAALAADIESFDEDDDVRIAPDSPSSDTVPLPKIPTNVPSIRRAEDDPTISVPKIPQGEESPTIRIPSLPKEEDTPARRSIDFFDEL